MKPKIYLARILVVILCFSGILTSYSQLPLDNVKAYYPLNSNTLDVSGNQKNGTVSGAVPTTDRLGNIGGAYYFDGINDKIELPNTTLSSNSAYAISLWFQPKGLNNDATYTSQTVFDLRGQFNTWLSYNESNDLSHPNSLYFYIYNSASNYGQIFSPNNSISLNQWYHVVCTYSNNTMELYINGSLMASASSKLPPMQQSRSDYMNAIGKDYWTSADRLWVKGDIDEVILYGRGLTSSEVTALYNRGLTSASIDELFATLQYVYDLNGNRIRRKNLIVTHKSSSSSYCPEDTTVEKFNLIDENAKEEILVYPNPTKDELKISISELGDSKKTIISIYDLKGILKGSINLSSEITIFNLSNYPMGTYILKIATENQVKEWTIIKN